LAYHTHYSLKPGTPMKTQKPLGSLVNLKK